MNAISDWDDPFCAITMPVRLRTIVNAAFAVGNLESAQKRRLTAPATRAITNARRLQEAAWSILKAYDRIPALDMLTIDIVCPPLVPRLSTIPGLARVFTFERARFEVSTLTCLDGADPQSIKGGLMQILSGDDRTIGFARDDREARTLFNVLPVHPHEVATDVRRVTVQGAFVRELRARRGGNLEKQTEWLAQSIFREAWYAQIFEVDRIAAQCYEDCRTGQRLRTEHEVGV